MNEIGIAIGILVGLGFLFGIILAVSNKVFRVFEDPRIDDVEEMLPGSNCGACGMPGCRAFAETVVEGKSSPSKCTVCSPSMVDNIADYLGVDAGSQEKRVARLLCAGGHNAAPVGIVYKGHQTCRSASVVTAGSKICTYGCLGLGDCKNVCGFDAITMSAEGLPVVDISKCTACGDCVDACPKRLFEMPISHKLLVQCKSTLKDEEALDACKVACTGCGLCSADAPDSMISMKNNLPVIDYRLNNLAEPLIIKRCPTGAINWIEGCQFTEGDEQIPLGRAELVQYTEET